MYKLRHTSQERHLVETDTRKTKFRLPKLVADETPKSSPRDTFVNHPLYKYDFLEEEYHLGGEELYENEVDHITKCLYCKYDYFSQEAEAEGTAAKFPRIVLKGVVGQELDTDTSYQRVINEAKWRMSMGEQPMESEDWRLPHATLPARPGRVWIYSIQDKTGKDVFYSRPLRH